MRILLAFDKFKGALSADAAADAAAEVIQEVQPDWTIDRCPLTDGGEGFVEILTRAAGGSLYTISVPGPRGATTAATYGEVALSRLPPIARQMLRLENSHAPTAGRSMGDASATKSGRVLVMEMAAASGLVLLPAAQRDPWHTSTRGTGEMIAAAAGAGADAIVLGLGGSATNDLGLGALAALGLKFLDANGRALPDPIPARWSELTAIDGNVPAALPPLRLACDVTNPLLGPRGAAAIYGPQKGLRDSDIATLDSASERIAELLCRHSGQPTSLRERPGAGAAGGIAFGLMAAARAELLPGFPLVAAWMNFAARLAAADIVVTGEGQFDRSSGDGKAAGGVITAAVAAGKPVHVFAGRVTDPGDNPKILVHEITPTGTPRETALREAQHNLRAAVRAAFAR